MAAARSFSWVELGAGGRAMRMLRVTACAGTGDLAGHSLRASAAYIARACSPPAARLQRDLRAGCRFELEP
jgi:hypothetical protein